jgi:hypothetical protein
MKVFITFILLSLSTISWGKPMDQQVTKDRIIKIYNDVNINTLNLLDDFYAGDIEFHDPITSVNGMKDLKTYYEKTYKNVKSIKFDFLDFVIQDHIVVAMWEMTYTTDKLNGGDPIKVLGTSHLKFNGDNKVYYHRDYLDAGAMVYEHVPFVGFFVRKIKKSLQDTK